MNYVMTAPIGGGMQTTVSERPYKSKIGQWMKENEITPMRLVREASIGVSTAYKAGRDDPTLTSDTLYKIYNNLRNRGFQIEEKDVIEIL